MAIYALDGAEPTIADSAFVHPDAVVIGNVTIGEQSSIWPSAVLRGDEGLITIGDRTSIQDGTVIHVTDVLNTVVGDECVIGHLVHLEGCVIENGVLVGNGAVVLHRAIVRTCSLVGSNAVVTNDMEIPSKAMALGVPAKIRHDVVTPDVIDDGLQKYIRRTARYRQHLRRID